VHVRFGPFSVDDRTRQLLRGSKAIHLSPKAFDLLTLLLQRRPEAVSKAEMHEHLWHDTFVADINIAVLIAEVRTSLGENARHPCFIRTVHRFGYAFCSAAVETPAARSGSAVQATCWLTWSSERAALTRGENLIGRDPTADVYIDAIGMSRRHAMIVVADEAVVLHDLSSKNGTYIGDVRVTAPTPLVDGTEIRFGPASVRFHGPHGSVSTVTLASGSSSGRRKST
jgi:DNA-binding winged helix-turn-helix (wHTH) protein